MPTRWSFFSFHWDKYQELKPALKSAWDSGDFSNLDTPGADEILDNFDENSDPSDICNTLILELCGEGEPLHFEEGLPGLILELRRNPRGEDAADLLGCLVTGEPFVEDWWRAKDGLAGILTPEQLAEVSSALAAIHAGGGMKTRPKGLAAIAGRFVPTDAAKSHLNEMVDLITESAAAGLGLALMRED